jgi:hypothetical protein
MSGGARKSDCPSEKVEAMLSGLPTSFADEREQIVYEMAICLGNSAGCRRVSTTARSRHSAVSASPT